MVGSTTPEAGANGTASSTLGRERLLGVPEVCAMTGLCPVTAAKLMKESGRCICIHRRLYLLESSFFNYLRELEVGEQCSR